MPADEEQTASPAGVFPPDQLDAAALFDRLRAEVEFGGDLAAKDDGDARRARARATAERFRAVTAERPVGPGPKGLAKRALRKLFRWYVEPVAAEQRAFNAAALTVIDELSERSDSDRASRNESARLARELEERLLRLERRGPVAAPATVALQPAASALPDYFAFESRMRGSTHDVRERQRAYVDDFREASPVLDIGCGRGEFLNLLREAGIAARGVEPDADMAAFARGEGLEVEQADGVSYLDQLEDRSIGGIFLAQVVEHLPPGLLVRLLTLAAAKLRPGGVLVAETINPLSPLALRNYYADLTHAQPLVPETLALLASQAGLSVIETRYLNEPGERLETPADPVLAQNVRRLNELLYAPLDYAIIARAR